jgi:hypothetical protein
MDHLPGIAEDGDIATLTRNISRTMEGADVAGLFVPADIKMLARAVAHGLTRSAVGYPGPSCPGCQRPRHSFRQKGCLAAVVDVQGIRRVNHVPSRCQAAQCPLRGKLLWANFSAGVKGARLWKSPQRALPRVFMLTPRFGVSLAWYQQFSRRLLFHQASFEGEANVHKNAMLSVGRVSRNLIKSWMTMRILERMWQRSASDVAFRLDVPTETALSEQYPYYYNAMRSQRVVQSKAASVDTSYQVIDGHSKLTRRTCCVTRCCRILSSQLGAFCLAGCSAIPPVPPRRSKRPLPPGETEEPSSSRARTSTRPSPTVAAGETPRNRSLCCKHDLIHRSAVVTDIQRLQWKAAVGKTLDELVVPWILKGSVNKPVSHESLHVGAVTKCQVDSCVKEFKSVRDEAPTTIHLSVHDDATEAELGANLCNTSKMTPRKQRRKNCRSGGFLVSCTSEGYITDAFEFMGTESLSQRYLFLARLKGSYPELKVVVHDDACHLRQFCENRRGLGPFADGMAYPNMYYILDRFHAPGHVDVWCRQNVCPSLPENANLMQGKNSSICEITFSWLRRYKHMFRTMNQWTANFFVQEMIQGRNDNRTGVKLKAPSSSSSSSSSSSEGSGS